MEKIVGLRVDVDFEIGLTKGVPYLLKVLEEEDINATFYITFGPDGFKHHRNRINTPGYLKRILLFNPWKIVIQFGPGYLLKQFLGRGGSVGSAHPEILQEIQRLGHELGVHGYDHYWWAENIWVDETGSVADQMEKGLRSFYNAVGADAHVWSAPNWRCSQQSLELVDNHGLLYGADSRGYSPFFPMRQGWVGQTPQFPISMPCLHEIKDYIDDSSEGSIMAELVSHLTDNYNVWCIHGYYEGILERRLFLKVVREMKRQGYRFVPIIELFRTTNLDTIPTCRLIEKSLPGGRGEVSYQGDESP